MTSVDDSLLVPAVHTRSISGRRTTQARKCTRHKTKKAQMTGHQTGTVCKRSLGTFSRAGLRKNSFGGATRNSAAQHGRQPSSMSRQPRPSKECTHSEAMERVLSDSPRTTMGRKKKKKKTGPHHDAREREMEGRGGEGGDRALLLRRRCNDAQGRPYSHPCYALVKTAARVEEQKRRWPASNHANVSYRRLSHELSRRQTKRICK